MSDRRDFGMVWQAERDERSLLRWNPPKPDESFLGFLLRMAEANGYDSPRWILQKGGIECRWGIGAVVLGSDVDLGPLARLVHTDVEIMNALRYQALSEAGGIARTRFCGVAICRDAVLAHRARLCPDCLRDSPYVRRVWELFPVTACPTHHRMLIDKCPGCGRRIPWARKGVAVCTCGHDLRIAERAPVEKVQLGLSALIHKASDSEGSVGGVTGSGPNNPLALLSLDDVVRVVVFIANNIWIRNHAQGMRMLRNLRIAELHDLLCEAFLAFEEWPKNFHDFLDRMKGKARKPNGVSKAAGIRRDFEPFCVGFYRTFNSAQFGFMRDGFEEYLMKRWDAGLVHSSYKWIRSSHIAARKYLGKRESIKALGLHPSAFDGLLAQGLLKAIVQRTGKRTQYLVERESVERLRKAMDNSIPITQVMRYLGIERCAILRFVQKGFFQSKVVRGMKVSNRYLFERRALENFISRISERVVQPADDTAVAEISFQSAVHSLGIPGFDSVRFVEEILKGTITPCRDNKEREGLRRFRFDSKQVLALRETLLRARRKGSYAAREAAEILGINLEAVYQLNKAGLLMGERPDSGTFHRWYLIKEKDLSRFRQEYVTLVELTRRCGTASWYLRRRLEGIGILPVVTNGSHPAMPAVFRRREVEKAWHKIAEACLGSGSGSVRRQSLPVGGRRMIRDRKKSNAPYPR